MFYPIIVLLIAILIMGFLLVFIVPKFQAIFADMLGGKPLPPLTQFVVGASTMVKSNILVIVALVVGIAILLKVVGEDRQGAFLLDTLKLKAPLFGDLARKSAISRFSRTLGTLVTSGVPILQALNITRETAGNTIIADAIMKVHDSVKEGESIVHPLEASGVFPPMVISMIDVGEETGQLPEMLLKIAEVYDDEVDGAASGLISLLEPIMIVFSPWWWAPSLSRSSCLSSASSAACSNNYKGGMKRKPSAIRGFTLIEILIVIAIIAILAGLLLRTAGYVQKKGAVSRAEAEMSALTVASENYKADHGDYPQEATWMASTHRQATIFAQQLDASGRKGLFRVQQVDDERGEHCGPVWRKATDISTPGDATRNGRQFL